LRNWESSWAMLGEPIWDYGEVAGGVKAAGID